jgi:hypothetical protein
MIKSFTGFLLSIVKFSLFAFVTITLILGSNLVKTVILVNLFASEDGTFIRLLQSFATLAESLHWRRNRFSLLTENFIFLAILPDPSARLPYPLAILPYP